MPWYLKLSFFAVLGGVAIYMGILALYPWGFLDYRTTMDLSMKALTLVMIPIAMSVVAWIVAMSRPL